MKFDVPFIKPSMPHHREVAEDYERIITNNWFTNFGPFEARFRDQAKDFLDNGALVTTVANATLGLDLSIRALIDKRGVAKDILMPSFTFAAGANVVLSNGFRPVFIDIEEKSWQPSLGEAEEYIANNRDSVAGILFCNIFGVGASEISKWEELAQSHEIPLIIDSAAGFGSQYEKRENIGARGDCEVFSLHATKPFAVGEGGLVSSKNIELLQKIRQLQNFGFDESRQVLDVGTNAKLQEINCAIGLRQLKHFKERLIGRRAILNLYKTNLNELGYEFQENSNLSTVAFASAAAPDVETNSMAIKKLNIASVETRRYYSPLHLQRAIANLAIMASDLDITENIASRIISLPVHDNMDTMSVERVTEAIGR